MNSRLDKAEVAKAQVGPRELKDPRSREYAIQTLYALKRYTESARCDLERVKKEIARIDEYRHWEVLGYPSRKAMLKAELSDAAREKVEQARADATIRQGHRTDLEHPDNVRKLSDKYGNSESYTLRRLARQRPDLLEAFERGELSANAAAIEAGFRVKTITVPLDPVRAAAALKRAFAPDALQLLLQFLS